MTPELQKYIDFLNAQKVKASSDLARAKASLERINEKLAYPENYFKKEMGSKKVGRLVSGEQAPKKTTKPILRKPDPVIETKKEEVKKESGIGFW